MRSSKVEKSDMETRSIKHNADADMENADNISHLESHQKKSDDRTGFLKGWDWGWPSRSFVSEKSTMKGTLVAGCQIKEEETNANENGTTSIADVLCTEGLHDLATESTLRGDINAPEITKELDVEAPDRTGISRFWIWRKTSFGHAGGVGGRNVVIHTSLDEGKSTVVSNTDGAGDISVGMPVLCEQSGRSIRRDNSQTDLNESVDNHTVGCERLDDATEDEDLANIILDDATEGYTRDLPVPDHLIDCCECVMDGTMKNTQSGQKVYLKRWEPKQPIRSLMFIAHDVGEHSGRYEQVLLGFLQAGVLVFAHDHQGHGQSEGERADMPVYMTFVIDILKHLRTVKQHYAGLPLFGWGHGMGACLLITLVRSFPAVFTGLMLTSPMIRVDPWANTIIKKILASTVSFIQPSFGLGHRVDAEDITDDILEQQRWLNDPYIYRGQTKIRWANCMLQAMELNSMDMASLNVPFVTIQGNQNDVVLSDNAMFIYTVAKSTDKQLKYIDGGRHDLHACSPSIKDQVMTTLYTWVKERTPTAHDVSLSVQAEARTESLGTQII
eukprot:CFRG6313T1